MQSNEIGIMSDAEIVAAEPIVSCEYVCKPRDSRCRYWAKVVRADMTIPLPSGIGGANDVPGTYQRLGDDVTLFPGDFVLEGEEAHHVKKRGWVYNLGFCNADGQLVWSGRTNAQVKAQVKALGRKDLLGGSGEIAHMIREIHVRRIPKF